MSVIDDRSFEFPRIALAKEDGPVYFLWVFDPQEDKVHLEHNEGRHKAEHIDHSHLAARISHPDRVHGFAYKIRGGWRVTTWEHRPVDDPHVLTAVKEALGGHRAAPRKEALSQVQSRAMR